jgi:EmrB/QacA subfamily drug resistance transporter
MTQSGQRLAYKWKVLISVIFGIFMVILDTTVVNVAFQTLRREFGATLAQAQWIISVYVLALGIGTPLAGFLADRFGIKRTYLTGIAVFVVGSLLCGLAPGLWSLVAARALQGFGGGIALPLGTALLLRTFPANEQGRALGFFGMALVVAPALGPILGGWLVDLERWRWIFFINLPIGALGIFLASRFLREERSERKPPLDWPGVATAVVGFGATLYAASIAEARGWGTPEVLLWFGIGAAALGAFVVVELFVAKVPLLDLRLFREPTFLIASLVGYVSVLALFGAEFLLPVYLQGLRGRTALETGFILLPLAVAAGVATPVAGRWYDRIGPRPLLVAGFSLLAINTWQFSELDADTPIRWISFLLVLRGLALGMTVQTTFVTALSTVSGPMLPRGSSLVNATRQVVQSIGVAVLATVLASTLSPQVRALQSSTEDLPTTEGRMFGVCQVATHAPAIAPGGVPVSGAPGGVPGTAVPSARPPFTPSAELLRRACAESVAGFERAYRLTFYMALAALFLGALLPGWPFAWTGRKAAAAPAH